VNNSILELLTKNLDKPLQIRLIHSLSEDEKFDLSQFFPDLSLTKDNQGFIKSIYPRTKSCISQATNIMNYHLNALKEDKQIEHEEKLFKMIEHFEQLVGPKNYNWRDIHETSKEPPNVKVKSLLKYIRITPTQSIIYLYRNASPARVEEKLRIMEVVHNLIKVNADLEHYLTDDVKLCFIKLASVKLLGSLNSKQYEFIRPEKFRELELMVITYSKHLCEVDYDHSPEPYLFFLVTNFLKHFHGGFLKKTDSL
jgi:hypothetical protein